jgi:heme/copper-type cytochrome/quinol oxidase subunit 3
MSESKVVEEMSNQIGLWLFFLSSIVFFSLSMELTTLSIFQADVIMSRLNIDDYQKEGSQPTLLITSDIVCAGLFPR